jgi:tRNA-specific 2-thiouridylase
VTPEGEAVGRHDGLVHYTIGQRSGIGIGGRREGAGEPWYVAARDARRNALVVVQGREHPLLWSGRLRTGRPRWLGAAPEGLVAGAGAELEVRIRHRHGPVPATVSRLPDGGLDVGFVEPQWAVAPGQYAVFYAGDECLGGAVIEQAETLAAGAASEAHTSA